MKSVPQHEICFSFVWNLRVLSCCTLLVAAVAVSLAALLSFPCFVSENFGELPQCKEILDAGACALFPTASQVMVALFI